MSWDALARPPNTHTCPRSAKGHPTRPLTPRTVKLALPRGQLPRALPLLTLDRSAAILSELHDRGIPPADNPGARSPNDVDAPVSRGTPLPSLRPIKTGHYLRHLARYHCTPAASPYGRWTRLCERLKVCVVRSPRTCPTNAPNFAPVTWAPPTSVPTGPVRSEPTSGSVLDGMPRTPSRRRRTCTALPLRRCTAAESYERTTLMVATSCLSREPAAEHSTVIAEEISDQA